MDSLKRIKIFLGCKSDAALAKRMGMSRQNFLAQKKTGSAQIDAFQLAVDEGANENWLLNGEGDMKKQEAQPDQVTLRDIVKLHETINDQAKEIGDLKRDLIDMHKRMLEAAQTGDINRLGEISVRGK